VEGGEAAAGGLVEVVAVEGRDVLQIFFAGDVVGEFEGGGELAVVDAVEEVAVVDEEAWPQPWRWVRTARVRSKQKMTMLLMPRLSSLWRWGRIWRLLGPAPMARQASRSCP
jgi:hypothetical protein